MTMTIYETPIPFARMAAFVAMALLLTSTPACSDDGAGSNEADPDAGPVDDTGDEQVLEAKLGYTFETYHLPAGEEHVPCVQWTLNNEKPLYVNSVTMGNDGGFHHSNWYVVPEHHLDGDDGYFTCSDRGWSEQTAALMGTVLFAQSTQSLIETQQFPEGVVTKIPPNHMIVADLHFLNTTPEDMETQMRLELGLLHPKKVETIAAPFRLDYRDLDIPAQSQSRFRSQCDIAGEGAQFLPVGEDGTLEDVELYYVLPHYHDLGNYFDLRIYGGPDDGKSIFELEGFNAEANGQTFNPPIDLTGAKGLEFSCGFNNPRDEDVGWGIGDQEMCMMLGYTNAGGIFDASVGDGDNEVLGPDEDGIVKNTGPCDIFSAPASEGQSMPGQDELDGDLYVPDSGTDDDFQPAPDCFDIPDDAQPLLAEPTLTDIEEYIFEPSCSFSACHGAGGGAAGLSLVGDDLHDHLLNHQTVTPTQMELVEPGDASQSWLYEVMAHCEPQSDVGPVNHMPLNSPALLPPDHVAMVREWIDGGAQGD